MLTSTARSTRSSSQSISNSAKVRSVRSNLLDERVLLQTIRRMAVGLGLGLVLLGVVMLLNVERIDAWQRRRFPRRPITPTRWQGALIVVFGIVVLIGEAINRT